jgi:hypothetical protein
MPEDARSLALALITDARSLDFSYSFAISTSYIEGSNVSAEWVLERLALLLKYAFSFKLSNISNVPLALSLFWKN